jgi:hypothetical protein
MEDYNEILTELEIGYTKPHATPKLFSRAADAIRQLKQERDAINVIAKRQSDILIKKCEELADCITERDEEVLRNRPLRNLIKHLEEQQIHFNKKYNDMREAINTIDSEREANLILTEEIGVLKSVLSIAKDALETYYRNDYGCMSRGNDAVELIKRHLG